ncbi:uncharacterized protein LOC111072952 isoform X2 [Drosophila obscura]|uniref:uncharacterized protein LOC111072952 isoform X2 n=1 Tax=Drosophila obscura TaxID=7282 RepID=UPI001BB0DE3D|nr:uncharacterized protein LOC111072952 isoform X2 [Drosophila obscura]
MPRKKSEVFYKEHGFTAKCVNGKYTATCIFCNKELRNTALTRLSLHRQTCDQKRDLSVTQSLIMECVRPVLKIHKITHEDADGGIDHGNEGKEIIVKIQEFLDQCDDDTDSKDQTTTIIKSELPNGQQDSPYLNASKEDYHTDTMEIEITAGPESREYVEFLDEYKEVMSLDNSANGTETNYGESRPKNNLASLKADKTRAEIKQFHSKTQFLKTETENLKLERTLALLRIQKLRLEIDSLRAQS